MVQVGIAEMTLAERSNFAIVDAMAGGRVENCVACGLLLLFLLRLACCSLLSGPGIWQKRSIQ